MMNWRSLKPVTYILAAVTGGLAGWIVKSNASSLVTGPASITQPAKALQTGGAELLEAFVQKQKSPDAPAKGSLPDRFNELSKTLPVSADPAADFQKLLAEFSDKVASGQPGMAPGPGMDQIATLGILLGQWIDLDAKAAFTFVGKGYASAGGARIVANVYLNDLATKYLEKRGLPALMGAISGTGNLVNSLAPGILHDLGKRGSAQELEQMKEKAPAFFVGNQVGHDLGKEWPVERRDELLAALDPKSAANAMAGIIGRMEESSGGEWILTNLKNGGFSQEIRDAMAAGMMGSFESNIQGATLQQRLEIMRELGTLREADEERIKDGTIHASLRSCFNSNESNDDFLFSLRHGVLSAEEVVELAKVKTLDPGEDRAEYNSQMFRTLAEENLPAALDLLAGMPAAEQEKQKALAARWSSRDLNPDDFLKLTESVNAADDDELQTLLQDAWNEKSSTQIRQYGASYLDWIKALPDGVNKTRALKSIERSGFAELSVEAGKILKQP